MYDYDKEDADKTIKNNKRVIYYIIEKYFSSFKYDEDAIQCARIGMYKAWKSYDPDKGCSFATYATRVMMNEVRMYIRKQKRIVKYEVHHLDDIIGEDKNGNTLTLLDVLYAPTDESDHMVKQEVEKLIDSLSRREKMILYYLDAGYNQRDIAAVFNISQSYVSRIISKIKKKFMNQLVDINN